MIWGVSIFEFFLGGFFKARVREGNLVNNSQDSQIAGCLLDRRFISVKINVHGYDWVDLGMYV